MRTYQVRGRAYSVEQGQTLTFPGHGVIELTLDPPHFFGGLGRTGRTFDPDQSQPRIGFDSEHGRMWIEQDSPLEEIDFRIADADTTVSFIGNAIKVERTFSNELELYRWMDGLLTHLPPLLSLEVLDVPIVSSISGTLEGVHFQFVLSEFGGEGVHRVEPGATRGGPEEVLAATARRDTRSEPKMDGGA